MRFSRSSKATALLLLVSLQYTFAALDVAICSSALCYPKVTGGKVVKATKQCPGGYSLEKDAAGKATCAKRVAKACVKKTSTKCMAQPVEGCPAGYSAKKDCGAGFDLAVNKTAGRHLLTGNPLVKEINFVGHSVMPNIILPKPAVSINIAKPTKPPAQPKINFNGNTKFPQMILPEPKVSFNMPPVPKVGPEIRFEGHPSLMPKIIPVLPEPLVTVEVPKGGMNTAPKVTTEISTKHVTLDLSQLGPKHTVDVNLPAMPDMLHQATKIPDIEVNLPDTPKVIDLSGLGPKKIYNITLPQVKLPKQGSLTIINSGANEAQYLDLTHLGHKHRTGVNIKLPEVKTNGATVNVIVEDDKSVKDNEVIVIPGHKEKHNTVINVPGPEKEWPVKNSKLVVDIQANPKLHEALEHLQKQHEVERVSIKMPDIDLTKHMPAGKDVVVEVKPLLKFDHAMKEKPDSVNIEKRVNIEMKNITIPRLMNDTTILIKPIEVGSVIKHVLPKHMYEAWKAENAAGGNTTMITTNTIINMPNKTLPDIPVPKDKIDAAVSIPLKMGLAKNSSHPDGVINIAYKEEWTGGNPILSHPGAKAIQTAEHLINAVSAAHCSTTCCAEVEEEVCEGEEVQTAQPVVGCESGWTLDAATGTCSNGEVKVATCPGGMSKCHIDSKGVCVPAVEGKAGHDLCDVFKAVCPKGSVVAKSCSA